MPDSATESSPDTFARRANDWRFGPVVYHVFVDRFAPSADLDAKRHHYPSPRTLHTWDETPTRGEPLPGTTSSSHQFAFWGGDLASLRARLDYIHDLGADVLYLNPIHAAATNHKYDAQDYFSVSPEYGTREDVTRLATDLHERHMRLMLDGVFNHMGATSPQFQDALNNPDSPWRQWYYIGDEYTLGYRAWHNAHNLPEVRLENPQVRDRIWRNNDSVVRGYLNDGVDGWRLDVAYDIGYEYLADLTNCAHETKPDSCVIGEIWNYPHPWTNCIDGTMNFPMREIILALVKGEVTARHAGAMLARMIEDVGIEPILRCWNILDNHDTQRICTVLPELQARCVAQVLQFTLPGAPLVYYGTELGMTGGDDPECRAPMRWDLFTDDNDDLQWMQSLIKLRSTHPALRFGDTRVLATESLLGYSRTTDRIDQSVIVLVNPTDTEVRELVSPELGGLMSGTLLRDALSDAHTEIHSGMFRARVPAMTAQVLIPDIAHHEDLAEYSPFKRVV